MAAASRSDVEMDPCGRSAEVTSAAWIGGGLEGASRENDHNPPMPPMHASLAPRNSGSSGTSSCNRVGRDCRESAMVRKSEAMSHTSPDRGVVN